MPKNAQKCPKSIQRQDQNYIQIPLVIKHWEVYTTLLSILHCAVAYCSKLI